MENVKIDLFDLIRRILHQWKFVLIVTIIGGLVFEGIGYARAYMDYRQELEDAESEEEQNGEEDLRKLEDMESNLTEQEAAEIQAAASTYSVYMTQYQGELQYCQNSIKMQLDSNRVPTYSLYYVVSSQDANTSTWTADYIASAVAELANDEETCDAIKTALGWDTEPSYIGELIEVDTGGSSISGDDTLVITTSMAVQATIKIKAPTKEDCEAMAGIIKTTVEQKAAEMQENYDEFEITLLSEAYVEESDNTLRTFQDNRLTSLNTIRNAMNALSSNLADEQLDYYEALIAYNMTERSEKEISAVEDGTEDEADVEEEGKEIAISAPGIIRWRFILLGLALGFILACGYIMLRYMFARNLRVKDELENVYQIPSLGYIPLNDRKQQFTREERMEMICAGIRIAVQKADLKNVYITGTAGDGESEKVMEQMQEALADCGAQVSTGRDVAYDPASLEQMTASDGVVFVERVNRSPYEDIQKEVELCQMYNVPVIGSVVIE